MGYNGSNRRPKRSAIRKSSLNFGTHLVSRIITAPLTAVLETTSTKRNSRTANSRVIIGNTSIQYAKKTIKIPVEVMALMSSDKYKHIVAGLDDLLQENQSVERMILLREAELRRLKIKKILFMLFPVRKKKMEIDIFNLRNEIEGLSKGIQKEILDVKELEDVKREERLSSLKEQLMSSKLSISNESSSYFDTRRVYNSFMLNRVKAQISFKPNAYINYCPALTISASYIDLFFLGGGIVVKGDGKFAIIDYDNLNLRYQEVRIKEEECFNIDGYVLDSYTFLHSRKDGEADLRCNYNPQIPIIKYGNLSLEMSENLTLNLFFDNYAVGLQLYEAVNSVSYSNNQNASGQIAIKVQVHQNYSSKPNATVDSSDLWNDEMNNLLANADRLMENKKYEEAKIQYSKLLDVATVHNCRQLYGYIATERLEKLKDKMDLLESCDPNLLFNLKLINEIIEDAKFYEAEKDYKKALSKYLEVKMYGIMYSSLPYIDLAKTEIKKLSRLKNEE